MEERGQADDKSLKLLKEVPQWLTMEEGRANVAEKQLATGIQHGATGEKGTNLLTKEEITQQSNSF